MAENRGIAPPDMSTPVGQVRALIGDVEWTAYDPPVPGFGMYQKMSDAEIEGFLALSDGDPLGAAYFTYLQMASSAAEEAKVVQDLDLRIDLTKRASELRLIAQMWLDKWNQASADIFETFDTLIVPECRCTPELTANPVCFRGCYGRQFL